MHKSNTWQDPVSRSFQKFRRCIYIFFTVFALFCAFQPVLAHADLLGFDIADVYGKITREVKDINDILRYALGFATYSPYEIINNMNNGLTMGSEATPNGQILIDIINASKTMALVVATILLMVEFFRKTINFEWSSRWENILLFLVKVIVIKQVIQNSDTIIGYIYSGFNTVVTAAIGVHPENMEFLPYTDGVSSVVEYNRIEMSDEAKSGVKGFFASLWGVGDAGSFWESRTYEISQPAVRIFYPDATFDTVNPAENLSSSNSFSNPYRTLNANGVLVAGENFNPTVEYVIDTILLLVMKGIALIVFVQVVGRVFELSLYTILAPLPLATFASETTHDIAKSFIKSYIGTVLQVVVIVLSFIVFTAISEFFSAHMETIGHVRMIHLVMVVALGLMVLKSGAWSKKLCGAA